MRPRLGRLAGLVLVLGLLAGCQLDLVVAIQVEEDGSGSVTVSAGLDGDALARVGNLDRQLRVDDLTAAGWSVTPPTREGEVTWVRASKAFATPEQATAVLGELTAPDGPFRDFVVRKDDGSFETTYGVTGIVDLTGGPAAFGDAELSAVLGGDPFGGTLEAIEREEGRPVEEMVSFQVGIQLPGAVTPAVYTPGFEDADPTTIDTSTTKRTGLASTAVWVVAGLIGFVVLVVLRQGFKRIRA